MIVQHRFLIKFNIWYIYIYYMYNRLLTILLINSIFQIHLIQYIGILELRYPLGLGGLSVRGNHWSLGDSSKKRLAMRKAYPFCDVIMICIVFWSNLYSTPALIGSKIFRLCAQINCSDQYQIRLLHSPYTFSHYIDVIMTTMASQNTSPAVVYSTVYLDAYQRKHQSSASLAFVWGIHRSRWIPCTKGQLRGKCFHLMTSSWNRLHSGHAPTFPVLFLISCSLFTPFGSDQFSPTLFIMHTKRQAYPYALFQSNHDIAVL